MKSNISIISFSSSKNFCSLIKYIFSNFLLKYIIQVGIPFSTTVIFLSKNPCSYNLYSGPLPIYLSYNIFISLKISKIVCFSLFSLFPLFFPIKFKFCFLLALTFKLLLLNN